ncbi:MAG: tRNA uridine-5-carboxymethylaminomethyl(34) synthesis GTPase MnmE, partial [Candidatus Puniceispirillales bacterium]
MPDSHDTIFALATPAGRSALQVIRVSGPGAARALKHMAGGVPTPRQARLARITTPQGEPLDQGLVLFFKAPHSATGEDAAEFHLHGSPVLGRRVMLALETLPRFRLAEPGEFTRRGFLNGKLDLDQVEAIGDMIDADTDQQHRQAMSQLDGDLGRQTETWRQTIISLSARLEALIDFADEALPDGLEAEIKAGLGRLQADLDKALAASRGGILNRDGLSVALIGEPNAGKSTLLNLLAGDDRAIVSPEAGTTRDLVEVGLDVDGVAVRLTDTAGIREGTGSIEGEGIRRALDRAAAAAIVLVLIPADHPDPLACWQALSSRIKAARAVEAGSPPPEMIPVLTKADCAKGGVLPEWLQVSAVTGDGLDGLDRLLKDRIASLVPPPEPAMLTRIRHQTAVTTARDALDRALDQPLMTAPELMAEDLRLAAT